MADIYYAVIALKEDEIAGVVKRLTGLGLKALADYLRDSQSNRYGGLNERWQPFGDKTVAEHIDQVSEFQSGTQLIDKLADNFENLYTLRRRPPITVFFIDPFALFLEKYERLARMIDFGVSEVATCCLLIDGSVPDELKKQLRKNYCECWRVVCWDHRHGKPHEFIYEADDLDSFLYSGRWLQPEGDGPSGPASRSLASRTEVRPLTSLA
ncbi:MAG TPA: hypothetical protein VJ464_20260 [Blastocatellia bacterium]|nr:hypothetical protein [Blastocatellia bacterium]